MKIVYVYDAIARIGGVEKILADKMNYFADVFISSLQHREITPSLFLYPHESNISTSMPAFTCNISIKLHCDGG